jgi:hypothetical protein
MTPPTALGSLVEVVREILQEGKKSPSLAVLKKAMAGIDDIEVYSSASAGANAVTARGKVAIKAVTDVIVSKGWNYGEDTYGSRTTFKLYDDMDD